MGYIIRISSLLSQNRSMSDLDFELRMTPRLKGGWNVTPEEYKAMGYTPGLPPGLVSATSQNIREISSIFEICGLENRYLQSPLENQRLFHTIYVENKPQDTTPIQIVQFLIKELMKRGMYSSPGVIPDFFALEGQIRFGIIFPSENDVKNVISLDNKLLLMSTKLHFTTPEDFHQIEHTEPSFLFSQHPQRIMITNVDTTQLRNLPSFLQQFFGIDGFLPIKNMNDCVLVDVRPPMSPEVASSRINGKQFGNFILNCTPMRLVTSPEDEELPGLFNIPCDGLNLQQILQPDTRITTGAASSEAYGKTLYMLNVVPFEIIDNEAMNSMISYDIAKELEKYGKVVKCTLSKDENLGAIRNLGVAIVEFEAPADALEAQISIAGRKYLGRTIITILSE